MLYTSHASAPQQPAPWCRHPSHPPRTFSFWHTVSCGTKKLNCSLSGRPVAGAAPSASAALGCSQGGRGPGWSGLRMRGRSGHGGMGDSQSRQRVRRQAVEHDPSIRRTVVRSQGQQCHPGQRSARQQGQAGAVKTAATHQEVGGELGRVQVARMWRKPLEELLWSKEAATSTRSGHGGTLCETSAQQRGEIGRAHV